MTTRRSLLLCGGGAAAAGWAADGPPLTIPVRHVVDASAKLAPARVREFESGLWRQAERDFARAGVRLDSSSRPGDIWRPEFRQPVITGLERDAVNVVLTRTIPMEWDQGRALGGVATRYRGFHLCLISLDRAHGHLVPFVSLNTCVHELLHIIMLDIFAARPSGLPGQAREALIDLYATRMWLFGDGAAVRNSARTYLQRYLAS